MKRFLIIDRGNRQDPVSYSNDWVDAFKREIPGKWDVLQDPRIMKWGKKWLRVSLASEYDAIFMMHSLSNDLGLGYHVISLLNKIKGPRYMFLGNEYRDLANKVSLANELGCKMVFSQLPEDVAQNLYGPYFAGQVLAVPHGLNETAFKPEIAIEGRSIDIGYRGEKYPSYLGHNDRDVLMELFTQNGFSSQLKVDFAAGRGPSNRLHRNEWARFLNNCRSTVASETGSNFLSITDKLRYEIFNYEKNKPNASFNDLYSHVVLPLSKVIHFYSGRAISSRHFDAIGTGTALISFPGRFNDILKPDENYIVLNRDLSNINEVFSKIKDTHYIRDLTTRTREMVLTSHCLKHRIKKIFDNI